MSFKLGIVGHSDSLREIADTVHKNFRDTEIFEVEFGSDDGVEAALENVTKILGFCHGVLYTRVDPYKLISGRIEHNIPTRYVEINVSHLILALSKMMYHHNGVDITGISIDTLDYQTIIGAYKSLGIDSTHLKITKVEVDTNTKNFVNKAEEDHVYNYENKLSAMCVTSITYVYKSLRQRNIPCALLTPTAETYVSEIKNLMFSHKLKKINENQNVVICINIIPRESFYLYSENQFKEILETQKAREQIALFSQKLNGALIPMSDSRYVIVCSSADAEMATDNYTNIDLLVGIGKETMFNVSIGIGYGESARVARSNAVTGVNKAIKEQCDKAYVVYDMHSIIGPIEATFPNADLDGAYEKNLSEIADHCGLGTNTVYNIHCLIERKKTRRFSSAELAEALDITVRTANRVIAKLEAGGYAAQIGKQPIGTRGRPGRVIRLLV